MIKRYTLSTLLSMTALVPQLADACIATPAGVQRILPMSMSIPSNGIFYVDFIGGDPLELNALTATVNGDEVSIEPYEVEGVNGPFFTLSPTPVEGDEVEIIGLQGHDPTNLEMNPFGEIVSSLTVVAPYEQSEVPSFHAVSRVIKDQNQASFEGSNCDSQPVDDFVRQRTDTLHVLIPTADLSSGFVIKDGEVIQGSRTEVDLDGVPYTQVNLLVEKQFFTTSGPENLGEPSCVDLAFLSPIGELSENQTYCTPCVFETIGANDVVLERVVNSEVCEHDDLNLIDEYASTGEVEASIEMTSGGCDQTGNHTSSWTLLGLLMFVLLRKRTLNLTTL